MEKQQLSTGRNVIYHFIPGIIIIALFLLITEFLPASGIPKALLLYICLLAGIPAMLLIMKQHSLSGKVRDSVGYKMKLPVWKLLTTGISSFLWAALIMVVGKPVSNWFLDNVFWWMKDRFDLTGYLLNPGDYSKGMVIMTWAVGLVVASILGPFVEEIYFRGFLLPELDRFGWSAVLISALLFSLYHLFSPWMLIVRFVALLPMTFFIWKYKDIRIGILCHVLLNVAGDSVMAIPLVFS